MQAWLLVHSSFPFPFLTHLMTGQRHWLELKVLTWCWWGQEVEGWEIAQLIKGLLHKHGDPSLSPQHPHKKLSTCVHTCTSLQTERSDSPSRVYEVETWTEEATLKLLWKLVGKEEKFRDRSENTTVRSSYVCSELLAMTLSGTAPLLGEPRKRALLASRSVCLWVRVGFFSFGCVGFFVLFCSLLFCLLLERVLVCCSSCFQTPGYK